MEKEILVVDDQPGIRLLLEDVFTNDGYHVTTAETGKEALDQLKNGTVDLLLVDYHLPIVHGLEILQWLEQKEMKTPTIIMSGLAEEVTTQSKQFANVKEVVAKPFNIQDIRHTVHQLLTG